MIGPFQLVDSFLPVSSLFMFFLELLLYGFWAFCTDLPVFVFFFLLYMFYVLGEFFSFVANSFTDFYISSYVFKNSSVPFSAAFLFEQINFLKKFSRLGIPFLLSFLFICVSRL